jgi:hypothetical protein
VLICYRFLANGRQFLESSVNQHPNRAFPALHDLGDGADVEVSDDTQQDGFGLIGRQAADHRQRTVERRGISAAVTLKCKLGWISHDQFPTPFSATVLIDKSAVSDREQPTAKIILGAVERSQSAGHVDPHR